MQVTIQALDAQHQDAAFALATQVFSVSSTLHRALGISLDVYRRYLRPSFDKMADEGLSVVALDTKDTAVGCMIVTDFHRGLTEEARPDPSFAPIAALTSALCTQYHGHRQIAAGEVILVDMGAVSPAATGAKVYQRMRAEVHRHAKSHGFVHVVGELSSSATQHVVLNRLGHRKVAEIAFARFECFGHFPFQSITSPPSIVLAEGEL